MRRLDDLGDRRDELPDGRDLEHVGAVIGVLGGAGVEHIPLVPLLGVEPVQASGAVLDRAAEALALGASVSSL